MKSLITYLKIFAAGLLSFFGLASFLAGIFCLYGGPDGDPFCANAFLGTALGIGTDAIMTFAALALWRFNKGMRLLSLIVHEVVLLLWFVLIGIATIFSRAIPQIMLHPIVLLALISGGYAIFKTAKSAKAECEK